MNICVIPARGGSKRIPNKNIKNFEGKPIIAWSIETALKSGCFQEVIVSTDDNEIAEVAKSYGADVPFIRPAKLADDYTGTRPVIIHAIHWYGQEKKVRLNNVCCLYATAPFTEPEDLRKGMHILEKTTEDAFVFTATAYGSPIQRALKLNKNTGCAEMVEIDNFNKRSQDLDEFYHDAGQFYWAKASTWLRNNQMFEGSRMLILPRWRVQDIDTLDDWKRAQLMKKLFIEQR